MPQLSMRDALNQALHQEMARDDRVIVLGEDVSGGAGGTSGEREASGGIFGVTKGLLPAFGEERVIDTPISESAIVGAAAGAALAGLRPVAEIMFADFVGVCMDQIYNQIAKFRYMFGGKTTCPVVIRMAMGAGMNMGPQHSQTIYSLLTAIPGLKVVVPSNAYDAKGLLIQAIRDDDPVVFFEHKALYPRKCEVPENAYTVPFGEASLVREGEHVTVVAIARMVVFAERAIDTLAKDGISCDLIDPRTTSPLDIDTIIESVEGMAGWWSLMSRRRAAAWRPTSPRPSPNGPSVRSNARSSRSRRRTRPVRSRRPSSACTCRDRSASRPPSGRR